jgi:basic membrane lipoprotein Med (substrate-binding protein (PBP1-ABC) superfamily)
MFCIMKMLFLVPFLAGLLIGCGGSSTNTTTDTSATARASVATDTFSNTDQDDHPLESVAIDIEQAGIVHVGMSLTEVYQWFDSTQIQQVSEKRPGNNREQIYSLVSAEAVPLMILFVSASDTITSIIVHNPAYQTEKGIGVGSTFSQLSREYHIANIVTTEDKQVIATVEELQKKEVQHGREITTAVKFELGIDTGGLLLENNSVLPSSVPPHIQITRIFL